MSNTDRHRKIESIERFDDLKQFPRNRSDSAHIRMQNRQRRMQDARKVRAIIRGALDFDNVTFSDTRRDVYSWPTW